MAAVRCSVSSAERGERLTGTASRVDHWLLVEQDGPWDEASVPATRLGGRLTAALAGQARTLGARLLMIRRPATGAPGTTTGRRVYVVDSRPGHEQVRTRVATTDEELAELPADGWERSAAPLFLVCAHGKHDACCAIRGRPLAAALAAAAPEQTWECSHVGGDRFAPNALVLPAGLYYGRVPAERAAELVAATRAGRVVPEWLRGRSTSAPPVQAAQAHARAVLGLDGVDDLRYVGEEAGADTWRVLLDGGAAGAVAVTVRRGRAPVAARLTCRALDEKVAPVWEPLRLELLAPAA